MSSPPTGNPADPDRPVEDVSLVLMPIELVSMTPDEEQRLFTMLGRLIARAVAPDPGHLLQSRRGCTRDSAGDRTSSRDADAQAAA